MFAGNFAPAGWMFCEGQLLPISENDVLFTIFGTMYGGDGESTFALPDLRGRIPIHQGNGHIIAEAGGVESVTLTVAQITSHTHPFLASGDGGNQVSPAGALIANVSGGVFPYIDQTPPNVNMNPACIGPVGGSQPHTNFQPYLCVNFIVSLFGLIPRLT